ncbi:MAG: N-acetyl sugar amidotransferase [Saprospiraceae bacterium]|nr:N-acetyl sugar amidotransferase [Saprospiraceae bacterium]
MNIEYKICTFCVMDTTDPEIYFDSQGRCNHCQRVDNDLRRINSQIRDKKTEFDLIISAIKKNGKNKKFDCIIGVSGGVDSSYLAYLVKKSGLRPLALHLDNGWNSKLAVKNIRNLLEELEIELFTHVIDWDEFKSLQRAFLEASTPDSEIPSDHAILALLYRKASEYNIPIILGTNYTSESILPKSWSDGHWDWAYINKVNKLFGNVKLKTFPHYSIMKLIYYRRIKRIKIYSLLDLIDYNKLEAKQFLIRKFDWEDYGGKHSESIYTKFYQGYILPEKFGFDKRKAHLSSLIVAGQITREQALQELKEPIYDKDKLIEDTRYVLKKLEYSEEEFASIMKRPILTYKALSPILPGLIRNLDKKLFNFLIKLKNGKLI